MRNLEGVLYSANQMPAYLLEACASARSIKQLSPTTQSVLFTDLAHYVPVDQDLFSDVVPIETTTEYTDVSACGKFDRIKVLNRTPFKKTLHLDSDTRAVSSGFTQIFDWLDKHEILMVPCAEDASYSRRCWGAPMFNVGFIAYRLTPKIRKLLIAWRKLTAEHFRIASQGKLRKPDYLRRFDEQTARHLLFMDQTSFVQLLSPDTNVFDVDIKILEEGWNYRGGDGFRFPESPLIINHHPSAHIGLKDIGAYVNWGEAFSDNGYSHVTACSIVHLNRGLGLRRRRSGGRSALDVYRGRKKLASFMLGPRDRGIQNVVSQLLETGTVDLAAFLRQEGQANTARVVVFLRRLHPYVFVT